MGEELRMVIRASPILSFSLCCANIIGPAIRAPPIGEAQRRYVKRIRKNFLLALQICPALPIVAASIPPLRLLGQMSRSANNSSCGSYIALILLALRRLHRFTYWSRTRL